MRQSERNRLFFGPYRAPKSRVGEEIRCAIRGKVKIVSKSPGRMRWPRCRPSIAHVLIVCGDLERAIRTESVRAVAYWWGVTPHTVFNWRRALGVKRYTPGTTKLFSAGYADPKRNEKIAAAKRGKPRSEESKQKQRDAMNRYYGK